MPRCIQKLYNLPTPGIGEQGVLGTAPWRTEADRAALSGGPPGAERGTGSVRRATWNKDTDRCLKELSQRQLDLLFIPVAFDLVLRPWPGCLRICIDRQLDTSDKLSLSTHVLYGPSIKVDALTNCNTSSYLMLSISVRPLTHRCAPWSQWGPSSHRSHCHCTRSSHRHWSHCHPSLSNLCIEKRNSSHNLFFCRGTYFDVSIL